MGCCKKRKTRFLLVNQYFLLPLVKKLINTVTFGKTTRSRLSRWCASVMVEIDETEVLEVANDGWPKVI